ncbi:MAG: glycosyltransferase [Acidimicrobiales bacterium]
MKRRLRRFLLIGLVVTGVDLSLLVGLGTRAGLAWIVADLISVLVASGVSFAFHRVITFADDPHALVDHRPLSFFRAVYPAVAADVAMVGLGVALAGESTTSALVSKAVALAVAAMVRLVRYRRVLFAAVRADQVPTLGRPPAPGDVRLSVVLPAYRAAEVVGPSVQRLRVELAAQGVSDVEVVVVDDGSDDGTAEAARAAGADLVVVQPQNRGKGAAVRAGMLAASGRTRVFTDVDLAYPPAQIAVLLATIEDGSDLVVGSRRHSATHTVHRGPKLREVGSLVFNLFTYVVLLGQYRDTQSGLKGLRSDAADLIFSRTLVDGFAFDVEVLHLAERFRLTLTEVPVVLDNIDDSTVSFAADTMRMVRDVFRVRRWSAQGRYDSDQADRSAVDRWV